MPRQLLDLEIHLEQAGAASPAMLAAGQAILAIAAAGRGIAELLAAGPLAENLAACRGQSAQGEAQAELDLAADGLLLEALQRAPVALLASEEREEPVLLDRAGAVAVAVDPLDGSSNIDTNAAVGTIFSLLPMPATWDGNLLAPYLCPGAEQIAAGFLIYGPQTALLLTLGAGTRLFTLDRASGRFVCVREPLRIPMETREFAINGSNWRHWEDAIRIYIGDCLRGAEGPRGIDFNTRWLASLVGEAYRILIRGGIYLYPADSRRGYQHGRLRLIYEANPVAFLIEQAGGAATNGREPILALRPSRLHQRVPFVFGAVEEVRQVASCHEHGADAASSPLFGHRSLFREPSAASGLPSCR